MMNVMRLAVATALLAATGGCALLGGGKTPASLATLSATAPDPGPISRSANAGESVTIEVPVIAKEIRTTRVAAQVGSTTVAYIKDLTLVDTPDRLFKDLVAETVLRTTNRVVLDSDQSTLDPGLVVSGRLTDFGYEVRTGQRPRPLRRGAVDQGRNAGRNSPLRGPRPRRRHRRNGRPGAEPGRQPGRGRSRPMDRALESPFDPLLPFVECGRMTLCRLR